MHVLNRPIFGFHLKIIFEVVQWPESHDKNNGPDICPVRYLWGAMLQGSFFVCFRQLLMPDDALPLN
jgi:hypothetical protein